MSLVIELESHKFERLHLEKVGEFWFAQFAIDGKKYPPFYEPVSNTAEMKEEDFLDHLKLQSLSMISV